MSLLLLFNPQAATQGPHRFSQPTPPRAITVFDPWWANPRHVAVAGLTLTWAVEQPGALSAIVPVEDAHRFGVTDWLGLWVYVEHPTQGPWGGIIEDEPVTLESGALELAATDMHVLLMDRVAPLLARPTTAHAGALFRRAISDVQTNDPLPISALLIDESGPSLEVEWRGDNLYDLGVGLALQSGQEFDIRVNADRTIDLLWQERLGEDKRDRVLIAEGYQVAGGRVDASRTTVVSEIIGLAMDEDYARSSMVRLADTAAIERYGGRRQQVRRYAGAVAKEAVRARVRADLAQSVAAQYLVTVTLSAMHPVALDIRHGDTIRYWSHAKNRELDLRVMSRTVRDGTILELAGEGTEVRVPTEVIDPAFTPDMLSGLFAWYDADDASTVTLNGNVVMECRDKSGEGHDLIAPVITQAPTYQPNAFNGRAVFRYDGVDDALRTPGTVDLSTASAVTVFAVAKRTGASGVKAITGYGVAGPASTNDDAWGLRDNADILRAEIDGNVGVANFSTTGTLGSAMHVMTAVFDRALATDEVSAWLDGDGAGTRPSNANNTGFWSTAHRLGVGCYAQLAGQTAFWPGDIALILIYDRALSATEREAVWDYIATRWGI